MKKPLPLVLSLLLLAVLAGPALAFDKEVIHTSAGPLEITFIGHASLMFGFDGKVIHVDPWSKQADYATLPKADLILLTHQHADHLDTEAIKLVRADATKVILTALCAETVAGGQVMANGDKAMALGIGIEAVPAYNLVHKRENGEFYHPKGMGNGYLLSFGDLRVHVGGDTENIPEIKALKDVDYAFLPMNLPYTMTPEMVADAALAYRPKVLYPYHYGDSDTKHLVDLLKDSGVEVRVKKM